jgi:hypothetical protein
VALDVPTLAFVAPELAGISPERFNYLLPVAQNQINLSKFGALTEHATLLFMAHMITVANRKGNAMVQEEKVGDVSRKYATPMQFKSFLWTTAYGQELWALINRLVITPYVIGDDGNGNPISGTNPVIPGLNTGGWGTGGFGSSGF